MQIKDFSVQGMFKFLIVMNLILIGIFIPFLLLALALSPDSITWNNPFVSEEFSFFKSGNFSIDLVRTTSPIVGAIFILLNFLILTWIQSAWVVFIANITPLGRIKIGRN